MGTWGKVTLIAALTALAAPTAARADPTVTVAPVTGPTYVVGANDQRTDSRTPTFVILANTPGTLTCKFDSGSYGACGPYSGACPSGDACATFTPTLGGSGAADSHVVAAQLLDGDGNDLADGQDAFTFDLTPPNTTGAGNDSFDQENPLRPQFTATVEDDDLLAGGSIQCSFVPAGHAPRWANCPITGPGVTTPTADFTPHLARRHADYVFSARAVDDFGRADPSPITVPYDPVPCTLRAGHVTAHSLARSPSIPIAVACSGQSKIDVSAFVLQGYGSRRYSVSSILSGGSPINDKVYRVKLRSGRGTVHAKLNVGSQYGTYFRHYRTVSLVLVAANPDGNADDASASDVVVTVRR